MGEKMSLVGGTALKAADGAPELKATVARTQARD